MKTPVEYDEVEPLSQRTLLGTFQSPEMRDNKRDELSKVMMFREWDDAFQRDNVVLVETPRNISILQWELLNHYVQFLNPRESKRSTAG